jgi:hypothetical protein
VPAAVIEPEPVHHVTPLPPEPVREPAAVPAATSVAEAVLLDHPGPKPALPVTDAVAPEPKVEAPELQPNATTPQMPKP